MDTNSKGSSPGTVADVSDVMANAIAHAGSPGLAAAEKAYDKAVAEEPKPGEPAQPKKEPSKETPVTEPPSAVVAAPEEDEGYFADEGLDEPEPAPAPAPSTQASPLPQSFTAQEQYVAQNIGQPITVDIIVNDVAQRVQAYALENLPQGFKFASDYAAAAAAKGFAKLELKAEGLVADFERNQQSDQAKKFSSQEDRDIQRDIAYLQRQKVAGKDGLPLFPKGIAPDDPEFESHPAVKEMQEVLAYYNTENTARWQQSQRNGSQYRPLTYRDAFKLYRSENPVTTPKQAKEDTERKQITARLSQGNKGTGEPPKTTRPKLPWNAGVDQIARAYGL